MEEGYGKGLGWKRWGGVEGEEEGGSHLDVVDLKFFFSFRRDLLVGFLLMWFLFLFFPTPLLFVSFSR